MSLKCCHTKGRRSTRKAVNPPEWTAQQRRVAPRLRKFERLVTRLFDTMSKAVSDDAIRQAVKSGDPGPVLAPFAGLETPKPEITKMILRPVPPSESDLIGARLPELEANIAGDMLDEVYAATVGSANAAWIALDLMPGVKVSGKFNLANPYTAPAAQQRVGWLISEVRTGVNEGLRQSVANIVDRAYATGATPVAAAQQVRPLIGLLPGQINTIDKMRDRLLAQGVTGRKLQSAIVREAQKKLKYRANMIARTEIQRAVSVGRHDAWKDAQDRGFFGGKTAYVEWVAGLTDRTCVYCADLHGSREPLGEVFIANPETVSRSVEGETPPIHPLCRCTTVLILE
jgi:hypothetical protein